MAGNLRFSSDNLSCPPFEERECSKFGRYYTFDGAIKACPAGYHLPDQSEWEELVNNSGGKAKAQIQLGEGKESEFELLFSGIYAHRLGQLMGLGEMEIYWAALKNPSEQKAFTVYFHHEGGVSYAFNTTSNYFAVRCIKD
jgi:uncharacterized protein (TIGR02145 family)